MLRVARDEMMLALPMPSPRVAPATSCGCARTPSMPSMTTATSPSTHVMLMMLSPGPGSGIFSTLLGRCRETADALCRPSSRVISKPWSTLPMSRCTRCVHSHCVDPDGWRKECRSGRLNRQPLRRDGSCLSRHCSVTTAWRGDGAAPSCRHLISRRRWRSTGRACRRRRPCC